ncbi:unnamed protein product [Brachionus calyciflorus]|uniref:DIRP domain-containing protein n=1 Tax=Brachionus calyciflorus TaxID=104777 RepID=A0A813WE94_9BILA|nr:unnamed protein product [Brachionus calyciflorus]
MSNLNPNLDDNKTQIIKKLSNFLKLPKAQRWICCEWFYSDIDRVIFESENDFSLCIKQSFPRLKAQKLTRKQWCMIRSLIGKPRRCSDAFFQEERQMLEEKREKIRLIQQRKISEAELIDLKDLPQEIPVTLSIGHRVYTHICHPEEGVFLGTIAAVDPVEHSYRVVFDRSSIGSLTVHDYEIKSVTPVQTIPIRAYIQTYRPKTSQSNSLPGPSNLNISLNKTSNLISNLDEQSNSDFLITGLFNSPLKLSGLSNLKINETQSGQLGGFPIHLLLTITRLHKILCVKKENIKKLNDLNVQAECVKARNENYSREFQTSYSEVLGELDKLNKDLNEYLIGLQSYCEEAAHESKLDQDLGVFDLKNHYMKKSAELVNSLNKDRIEDDLNKINLNESSESIGNEWLESKVKSSHLSNLIISMSSIMMQLRDYSQSADKQLNLKNCEQTSTPFMSFCTKSLNESVNDIKNSLKSASNVELFEDKVQVHLNHIQSVLCNYNRLHAFNCEIENRLEQE